MTEPTAGRALTVVLREGDDLVVAELTAGGLARPVRLPGCQIPELRGYRTEALRHDRGVSVLTPAADGGTPVYVADGPGEEFASLPAPPVPARHPGSFPARHPAAYRVLDDGTTVLLRPFSDEGATVLRLPWRATAWEEVPVPERYDVRGAAGTPEEPLVLCGGRREGPDRSGESYLVPVLLTPGDGGDGWRETASTERGRSSASLLDRFLADPRRGPFETVAGTGGLWCASAGFGDWGEHLLLHALDPAARSWSFVRSPDDLLAGIPAVTADGVTAVTVRGRLLRYTRGRQRWASTDLRPALRGLGLPGTAEGRVGVVDAVVTGDRLVLVAGPCDGTWPTGRAVCALSPDGTSAEVLFEAVGPDHEVRAVTL